MIIKVKVKPGSKSQEITRIGERMYKVKLKERAEDNKANRELINLLAKYFKVGIKDIKIKNPKSRMKIVEIES